jgi:hypothetical protein
MATLFKTLKEDWSISATVAGFLAADFLFRTTHYLLSGCATSSGFPGHDDFMDLGYFYWSSRGRNLSFH